MLISTAVWVGVVGVALPAWGVPAPAAKKVAEGNAAYAAGDYGKALEAYGAAAPDCPECPELAYNQGLVHYRQRDFAKARDAFNSALATRDLHLEARAKFNLGNVAYSEALEKMSALKEAIERAEQATDRYRDALATLAQLDQNDPTVAADTADARANIETAALLIKDLLDKEKKKQEEQQKNQDKNQQKQDQQQNQDQQKDQQQQDQENKDEQQQQQDSQDQKQEDQQKQEGEQQQGDKKDEQEQKDQQGEQKDKEQEQQAEQQKQQEAQAAADKQAEEKQAEEGQEGEGQAKDARQLSKEEVQRLLQAVRDKEAQRREDRNRKQRVRIAPVERDW
jgi:Ca-activated chloride channel family protein